MHCDISQFPFRMLHADLPPKNFGPGSLARLGRSRLMASVLAAGLAALVCGTSGQATAQPSPPETEASDAVQPAPEVPAPDEDAGEAAASQTENEPAGNPEVEADIAKDADAASDVAAPAEPANEPAVSEPAPSQDAASEDTATDTQPTENADTASDDTTAPVQPEAPSAEAVATPAPEPEPAAESKTLKIATWSGAFGEAEKSVVIDRFSAEKSIDVHVITRDGKRLDLSKGANRGGLDATELSALEVDEGCKSGQLAKLTSEDLGSGNDFMQGSVLPCGIGSFAWAHVFVANRDAFQKKEPGSLSNVFDSKAFPGKRALIKAPKFLMEAALIADGAKVEEIYELLATEDGRARAFGRLDAIKADIIWFDSSAAAMKAFNSGEAVFAQTFSGRAFFDAARGHPVDIIWDGQIYTMTYWGIPADAKNPELAREFVRFATEPQQLAGVAQRFPYGPTRTAALALSKRHLISGIDLEPYLATAPDNMKNALALDEVWWRDNDEVLETAFDAWLSK